MQSARTILWSEIPGMEIKEGQVYRLEGVNKGGRCFSCGEVGHMVGSCPRNAWSKNRKNGFNGEGWGGVGRGRGRGVLDVEKRAIM